MSNKTVMVQTFDEEMMTLFIKDILYLKDRSEWTAETINGKWSLKLTGNCYNIQKEILNWLSMPERKQNMELLGDQE